MVNGDPYDDEYPLWRREKKTDFGVGFSTAGLTRYSYSYSCSLPFFLPRPLVHQSTITVGVYQPELAEYSLALAHVGGYPR